MRKFFLTGALLVAFCACNKSDSSSNTTPNNGAGTGIGTGTGTGTGTGNDASDIYVGNYKITDTVTNYTMSGTATGPSTYHQIDGSISKISDYEITLHNILSIGCPVATGNVSDHHMSVVADDICSGELYPGSFEIVRDGSNFSFYYQIRHDNSIDAVLGKAVKQP